jgi:hypothetical protein
MPNESAMANRNDIIMIGEDLHHDFDYVERDGEKLRKKVYLPKESIDKKRLAPFVEFVNAVYMANELVGGKFRINKDGAPELELNNGQIINEQNIAFALMMKQQLKDQAKAYNEAWDEQAPEIDRLIQVEIDSKKAAKHTEFLSQQLLRCEAKQEGMAEALSILNEKPIQDLNRNGQDVVKSQQWIGQPKLVKARTADSKDSE